LSDVKEEVLILISITVKKKFISILIYKWIYIFFI